MAPSLFSVGTVIIGLLRISRGVPSATLSSNAPLLRNGSHCSTDVVLNCIATDIALLSWFRNGKEITNTYAPNPIDQLRLDPQIDGIEVNVIDAVENGNINFIMITSTLNIISSSIERINGGTIQCGSLETRSNTITVDFSVLRTPGPVNSSATECSLVSSSGGLDVSLQWSTPFNMDHDVERYRVTVTPDPSSCSSDQVSPSEDYSCSGLDLEGNYSITASAINCGNQEGESVSFNVQPQFLAPQPPQDIEVMTVFDSNGGLSVGWMESISISGRCSFSGGINYTLILEDSTGMMVEERRVSSDTCSNGSCSTTFPPSSQICSVSIVARNVFGQSNRTSKNIGAPRLTSTNQVLLVLGAVLLCGAIAGVCIVLAVMKTKSIHPKGFGVVLLCGVVLIVVSVVLWVAVGFQVGLQDNTCDAAGQSSRDGIIIASFIFSVISVVTMVVASIAAILVLTKSKSKSKKIDDVTRKTPEIPLEDRKHELKPDEKAGGRVKALDKGEVMVKAGHMRASEEVFQQHSAAKQAEIQYAVTQHNINIPPVKVPPQTPTYSALETHKAGGEEKEKYDVLHHAKGISARATAGPGWTLVEPRAIGFL